MNVALCCIGRLENQYAREFVEWYLNLGFNKIYIYDNNHNGEEHFEDVVGDYVGKGKVEIVNFRDKEMAQMDAYNDCYSKHIGDHHWMAFFDFDEFLVIKKNRSIVDFLSEFDNFNCVKVNWMIYNDNNLVLNDGKPLNERFSTPAPYNVKVKYSFPENNHIKSIIRCNMSDLKWTSNPHVPSGNLIACNADGNQVDSMSPFLQYSFENAYLKHFYTKTIDEFVNNKMFRGTGDRDYSLFLSTYNIDKNFFSINKRTEEKMNFLNELNKKNVKK